MTARRLRRIEAARKRLVAALERQMRLADQSTANPDLEREYQTAVAATARAEALVMEITR